MANKRQLKIEKLEKNFEITPIWWGIDRSEKSNIYERAYRQRINRNKNKEYQLSNF